MKDALTPVFNAVTIQREKEGSILTGHFGRYTLENDDTETGDRVNFLAVSGGANGFGGFPGDTVRFTFEDILAATVPVELTELHIRMDDEWWLTFYTKAEPLRA